MRTSSSRLTQNNIHLVLRAMTSLLKLFIFHNAIVQIKWWSKLVSCEPFMIPSGVAVWLWCFSTTFTSSLLLHISPHLVFSVSSPPFLFVTQSRVVRLPSAVIGKARPALKKQHIKSNIGKSSWNSAFCRLHVAHLVSLHSYMYHFPWEHVMI